MGWSFEYGATKKEVIDNCTSSFETETRGYTCLARAIKGNSLWSVWEKIDGVTGTVERFIRLDLLAKSPGVGWGNKSMVEADHPYYYTCPAKYLDMAPVANQEWRDLVNKYHAKRKSQRELSKKLVPGERVSLIDSTIDAVTIVRNSPYLVGRADNGTLYRIPVNMVGKKLED